MSISVSSYPLSDLLPKVSKSLESLYKSKFPTLNHIISILLSTLKSIVSRFSSALLSILQPIITDSNSPYLLKDILTPFCFYFNEHTSTFTKINLETLKPETETPFIKFLASFKSGARVSHGLYFLHGGCRNYEASNETCLFDVYSNSISRLPKGSFAKNGGACVKVRDQVFAFSSTYPISCKSEVFDLSQKRWKSINSVPFEVRFMSGSYLNSEIYLTGAGVFGYLTYDIQNDSYNLTPGLSGGYKIMLLNYILSNDGLFEVQKEGLKKYNVDWICSPMQISIPFKHKNKIYFIDYHKKFCRLDLALKKIEHLN